MSAGQDLRSGKGHRDENFPVGSVLIEARHRPTIMAFYRFARTADDVADHPSAPADEKLRRLAAMRATLAGQADDEPAALALREALGGRGLHVRHGLELLTAFARDVTTTRYASWEDLMAYCRYSAAPVGRMVLDIHGEGRAAWPASDALCAALQVINHLQDCAEDRRQLDRVYLPQADLAAAGATAEALDQAAASPALRTVIESLAARVQDLLAMSRPLAGQVSNRRLAMEIAVIQQIAEDLAARLTRQDPLSEQVRHSKPELALLAMTACLRHLRPRRGAGFLPPEEARR
ncbi:MAG: squalene synthase HpnC [Phenylobacterium sp.]|jgi:squalene synthase HpnC|nr:squalene synthase HpnC [Phenylobacterium sp.]